PPDLSLLVLPAPEGPARATGAPGRTSSSRSSAISRSWVLTRAASIERVWDEELDAEQEHGGYDDEHGGQRQRRREVAAEELEYRQRGRLRDPLPRPGEHQRGAEPPQRAPPCESEPGAEAGDRARDRDPEERPGLANPEGARGVEQVAVDGLERRDRGAD